MALAPGRVAGSPATVPMDVCSQWLISVMLCRRFVWQPDMRSSLSSGILNGAMAGAMWGLVFIAPVLLKDCSPLQICIGRYLAYGLLSAVLLAPHVPSLRKRIGMAEWKALAWLSLTGNLVYFVLLVMAVQMAGGAASSLIVGMVPLVVALASCRSPGATPLVRLLPGLGLSIAGVVLIACQALGHEVSQHPLGIRLLGLGCAIGALLSWSGYSIGNSRWLARRSDISGHQWSLLTGLVTSAESALLIPVLIMSSGPAALHPGSGWPLFAGISVATALLASVVGNACWNRASQRLPLALSGQMVVFETLFALLYTFVWHQRGPTPIEVLAVICLLSGVALATRAHGGKGHA